MEVYIALLAVILALWLTWRWKRTSFFRDLGVPGPKPSLLFGNLLELYTKGPVSCHREWVNIHGRVVGFYYGMTPMLLVTDPQLLKNIFVRDFQKFINREAFNPLVKYTPNDKNTRSILVLPGQEWKDVRSVLTPTFTIAKMKMMASSMTSSVEDMLNIMKEKGGKEFEAFDMFQRLTMDVITRTAFGVKFNVQRDPKSDLLHATKLIFATPYTETLTFIGLSFPLLRRLSTKMQAYTLAILNKGRQPGEMLRKGVEEVLEYRRKNPEVRNSDLLQLMMDSKIVVGSSDISKLEAGNVEVEKILDDEAKTKKDIRSMTDDEIISTSIVVLLAGYETTSTALSYTTYLLAKHPDVQEELYQEIQQMIKSGQKLEYETVNKLPYMDKVINESMRLYPPVNLFTSRFCVEETQYGDLRIPKGTLIQAPVHLMHHDPEFWTDPETFDPERFNSKPNLDGITYLPFGVGPRNCLGMRFAQLEIKLSLAHILNKFRVLPSERSKGELFIEERIRTLTPGKGVYIKVEARCQEQ